MTTTLCLHPLDVLYLRGNRLFEGAGAHGEALMPPWPSVVAGAIRSRMLADDGIDLEAFASGAGIDDPHLHAALGTPAEPGAFRISAFTLACLASRSNEGDGRVFEPTLACPADLVIADDKGLGDASYLQPRTLAVATSAGLPMAPVLAASQMARAVKGLWLRASGWLAWLEGAPITAKHVMRSSALWQTDPRLGIALDPGRRTAGEGQLYTAETLAFHEGVSFAAKVDGADGLLPDSGLVRLGGDGRGAAVQAPSVQWPEPPDAVWSRIETERRFRLLLTTPGIFADGWRLPGVDAEGLWHGPEGVRARLVSAAVPRMGVVSGWDLALWHPKAARRVAPAGTVYWLDQLQGGTSGLRKLATQGLWACMAQNQIDAGCRAEGFNNVQVAAWAQD